jgi:hypothetical protein
MNYHNPNLTSIEETRGDSKRFRASERNQEYECLLSQGNIQRNAINLSQNATLDTKVQANFFKLLNLPKEVYHYDVSISPDANIDINHGIIKMIKGSKDDILTQNCVYDGRKALFSPYKLEFDDVKDFKVPLLNTFFTFTEYF